jgi:hypothetical protein
MKKLILGLTVVLSFLSCGKEGKTDELPAEDVKAENVQKNQFVVLLDAIYEKNDTLKVFVYDENDNEVLNSVIKVAVIGSPNQQKVEFKLPEGYTPFNLGIGFSCSNKEQDSFVLKGISIKNGDDLVYKPEEYLKYYANNDQLVMDVPTGLHKLKHEKDYPAGFVGNIELKSALSAAIKK